jgi:hypothetical protein
MTGFPFDRGDATAAIRFALIWVAVLLLALGAAPARVVAAAGRWSSTAFEGYRPYALGSGVALLAAAGITGL